MVQFIVSNLEDSGLGSLRQAIEDANAQLGKDEIVFDNSLNGSEIVLTSKELDITDSLQITGLGADNLTISGNNTNRVFTINDGTDDLIQVEIIDLTITEGFSSFRGTGSGGGIRNFENLTVRDSIINDNFAQEGGAGISNQGILDLLNSAVINNSIGGGIIALGGGGIYNDGTANITNSTIAFNEGDDIGGGIANRGNLEIFNSTITGNAIDSNGSGAGIYSYDRDSKIAITTITSSIVAGNSNNDDLGGGSSSQSNSFNSDGNNLIGNGDGAAGFSNGVNGDIVGTTANAIDPLLGTLQNNGGATPTIALLTGSPAIDAGSNPLGLNTDQRGAGFHRTTDGDGDGVAVTDIGAYEADPVNPSGDGEPIVGEGTENDTIDGSEANDIFGSVEDDALFGGRGSDRLFGNGGNDILSGGDGEDKLYGKAGDDALFGNRGRDFLVGSGGNDFLDGGDDKDTLIGGMGEDSFVIQNRLGRDIIVDYMDGTDILVLGDGLSFGQLDIVEENNTTEIRLVEDDRLLAKLSLVSVEALDESDFVTS